MNIQVGDYVAWDFRRHCFDSRASIALVTPRMLFKGRVTKIKTHDFWVFKRDYPLYKVNGVWVKTVKPIIRLKYYKWVSPVDTGYELSFY